MKKNNYSAKLLILILTVFLVILALPVSVFAAKKEKKLKSVKTYRNGKLINSYEFSYNKNGLETKETSKDLDPNGKEVTSTSKSTWIMWKKGSVKPKKRVVKKNESTEVWTFNKNGDVKKKTITLTNGSKEISTYKYKGKKLVSVVVKDGSGKLIRKSTYDKYENIKTWIEYRDGKEYHKETYKNKYKKGVLIESVCTEPDGDRHTAIYDKYGNTTSFTSKDKQGHVYYKVTYKNTYKDKGKYLKKVIVKRYPEDGDPITETVNYTYTSKKYPV